MQKQANHLFFQQKQADNFANTPMLPSFTPGSREPVHPGVSDSNTGMSVELSAYFYEKKNSPLQQYPKWAIKQPYRQIKNYFSKFIFRISASRK